ncbi:MAG: menaquinol oxidoreductase [Acidobacteria bacterium]|nr:MAG: menaquinol oxidoreductase [Acidobacteriota bacterium]
MRDRLIVGVVAAIAALVVAWPAWSRVAGWNRPEPPAIERPAGRLAVSQPASGGSGGAERAAARAGGARCIEPVAFMRASHMTLLADWRERAVRQGVRTYRATDGREFDISLSRTCLQCHQDKTKFCDRCHDYAAVSPGCWDCHLAPAPAPATGDSR